MEPNPLYSVWKGMRSRCYSPNRKQYEDYGGRGITVCSEWVNDFKQFVKDMGPRPKGYTLERKDNNGNYTKENCHWASRKEQQRNRRCTISYVFNGKRVTAAELAEINGLKFDTVVNRAKRGLPYHQIIQKDRLPCMLSKEARMATAHKIAEKRRAKMTCKRGHVLNEANTRMEKNGQRQCRKCHAMRQLHYTRKRKGIPTTFPA